MSDIFITKPKNGPFRAIQNKRIIATGDTQQQAANKAHSKRPNDLMLAERIRHTDIGNPDKWRRIYPTE
jgi:hypothetical protein